MEGLFQLIVFIIVILSWLIPLVKKHGSWEEELPQFPKTEPGEDETVSFEGYRQQRRKSTLSKEEAAETEAGVDLFTAKNKPRASPSPIPRVTASRPKPVSLKSTLREGIIWSIVLGPPRGRDHILGRNWHPRP